LVRVAFPFDMLLWVVYVKLFFHLASPLPGI
jgi:hypothetical protein